MNNRKVKGLSGLILASPDPDRLASFYKTVLGIPMTLSSHGGFDEHWECDFNRVHFAILERGGSSGQTAPIVPSFFVDNIDAFIRDHQLSLSQPVLELGGGALVGEINDPDGNPVRLWMKGK